MANVANIGVTLLVARLLSTRGYGALNQLVAVFFVLSIPGSALLVGIVRRVTLWQRTGHGARVPGWAYRTRRRALVLVLAWAVVAIAIRGPLAGQLSLPGPGGLSETLIAGGGLGRAVPRARPAPGLARLPRARGQPAGRGPVPLRADDRAGRRRPRGHRRRAGDPAVGAARRGPCPHRAGDHRPAGRAQSRRGREGRRRSRPPLPPTVAAADGRRAAPARPTTEQRRERRTLATDLLSALIALALLAILQNFDVVLLGREAPGNAGSYAPISVACKPLVLASFVLAGFLLPEAASRRHAGQHALRQLGVVLAVIAVPAALLIALSGAAPTQVLRIAFGPRLTAAAPAFLMLALAMTLLAATVLFTHYLLAAGRPVVLLVLPSARR